MTSCWKLDGATATLRWGPLVGVWDLARPDRGLAHLELTGEPIDGSLWGAVVGPAVDEPTAARMLEPAGAYVRENDFIILYGPDRDERSWQVDLRLHQTEGNIAAAIDVVVTVQTQSWDARTAVTVKSTLARRRRERMTTPLGETVTWPLAANLCYVEAVRGDDFTRGGDSCSTPEEEAVWRAPSEFHERGVLRRWRVRAALVSDDGSLLAAEEILRQLAGEPPLLSA